MGVNDNGTRRKYRHIRVTIDTWLFAVHVHKYLKFWEDSSALYSMYNPKYAISCVKSTVLGSGNGLFNLVSKTVVRLLNVALSNLPLYVPRPSNVDLQE